MSVDTVNDPSQNRGPAVLTVTIVFLCVSTAFVVLRLISRAGILKRVSWDDYFIVAAWVRHTSNRALAVPSSANNRKFLAFGFSFSICWGVHVGLGHHEANVSQENMGSLRKAEYAFSVLYVSARRLYTAEQRLIGNARIRSSWPRRRRYWYFT